MDQLDNGYVYLARAHKNGWLEEEHVTHRKGSREGRRQGGEGREGGQVREHVASIYSVVNVNLSLRRMGLIHTLWMHQIYTACMSPTLSGSLAPERFKLGDAFKICNRIIFDFYISGTTCI